MATAPTPVPLSKTRTPGPFSPGLSHPASSSLEASSWISHGPVGAPGTMGGTAPRLRGIVSAWLWEVLGLVLPRGCAGCDHPDRVLCPSCLRAFQTTPSRLLTAEAGVENPVAVHSLGVYEAEARRAVLAWKDHDDGELGRCFETLMFGLARHSIPLLHDAFACCCELREDMLVIPVPSSARSVRRRGRRHVEPLARAIARGLAAGGVPAQSLRLLAMHAGRTRSVQTLDFAQRAGRLAGRVAIRPSAIRTLTRDSMRGSATSIWNPSRQNRTRQIPAQQIPTQRSTRGSTRCSARESTRSAVLVDDIMTTGATLRQCAAVLERHDIHVVAAFTLAQTPAQEGQLAPATITPHTSVLPLSFGA